MNLYLLSHCKHDIKAKMQEVDTQIKDEKYKNKADYMKYLKDNSIDMISTHVTGVIIQILSDRIKKYWAHIDKLIRQEGQETVEDNIKFAGNFEGWQFSFFDIFNGNALKGLWTLVTGKETFNRDKCQDTVVTAIDNEFKKHQQTILG